jgi:hypothetical protein
MAVDFSAYLDLNAPKKNIQAVDQSKFKKKKTGGVDFDYGIGYPNEHSSMTTVVTTETYYNPNDYKVDCGDLSLYCAAMFGGPLY